MTVRDRESLLPLLERWRVYPPKRSTLEQIERHLINEYSAYEIPVDTIPWSDYVADEEVREEDVTKLFTITDQAALEKVFDDQDLQAWTGSDDAHERAEDLERDRRYLFEVREETGFRLLHLEQARGQRVTIALESRDGFASGFRVYNSAARLSRDLQARIGTEAFGPDVQVGNIDDPDFARYLLEIERLGLL
ncbi:MAG: hypothetical protein ACXIUP_04250 [Microcella sp.]